MTKKVAITGGIGSGKSTVLQYVRDMGYVGFSCDEIYREIVQSKEYIADVQKLFPECVIQSKIDKAKLSAIIFKDEESRKKLNDLAHPLIMESLYFAMDKAIGRLIFAEVPLLFEKGYEKDFDVVLVVYRNLQERIANVMRRDEVNAENVKAKISAQFDYDSIEAKNRFQKCNAILIENNVSKEELKCKLAIILASL